MAEERLDPLNKNRKLYSYEGSKRPPAMPATAAIHITEITTHIEKHIGPTQGVFHEIVSDQVHLDVVIVPPNETYSEWTLVTSGMSDRPMKAPKSGKLHYLELLLRLPAGWIPPSPEDNGWKAEKNYWPIRFLKYLSRFPHQYGAFVWTGHTLDNGQPATPWSNVAPGFKSAFLAPARTLPEAFENLDAADGTKIKFLALYPVYFEEAILARKEGAEALWNKFVDKGVTEIVDPNRPNLAITPPPPGRPSFWKRMTGGT